MDTTAIQRALIALGYPLPRFGADGDFGGETRQAMQAFQRGSGLPVTDKPDAATIAALKAAVGEKRPEARPVVTAGLLTALAAACGAKASPIVVQGIADNAEHLLAGGIDTQARLAEFLAQACLETDYFKTLREYWGPTAEQKRYEGRKDLGNVVAGDGKRFMGRGIFQCTGRANYAEYGRRLGIDLLKEPELAARPDVSVRIAVLYWNDKGLSAYADRGDTRAISRAINRGSAKAKNPANHEADRIRIARIAREQFAA